MDNANIVTVTMNPKEYFEKYHEKHIIKKHKGYLFIYLFTYLFIYLFILYLKVDKHQMQLCTLKK